MFCCGWYLYRTSIETMWSTGHNVLALGVQKQWKKLDTRISTIFYNQTKTANKWWSLIFLMIYLLSVPNECSIGVCWSRSYDIVATIFLPAYLLTIYFDFSLLVNCITITKWCLILSDSIVSLSEQQWVIPLFVITCILQFLMYRSAAVFRYSDCWFWACHYADFELFEPNFLQVLSCSFFKTPKNDQSHLIGPLWLINRHLVIRYQSRPEWRGEIDHSWSFKKKYWTVSATADTVTIGTWDLECSNG